MQFLFPAFLFGLAAVAIPVIIHLFNFRRFKTVYFSNVSFLKEIKEETASRARVKHLLVLAARILAIVFLVLAFAQPFIPKKNTNISAGKKYVSVYVDNSFSMAGMSGGVRLLDKAKQAGKEIAQNYAVNDEFQLLTNDLSGKQQRLVSKEEFLSMLDEVDISPASRNLTEIARRQADVLSIDRSKNKVAYMLSDFQRNMGEFAPDSTVRYNLIPLAADAQQNVYIDSAWFTEPVQLLNQNVKLIVRLKNSGDKAVEGNRLTLKLNGQTKGIADYTVGAGSYTYDTIGFVIGQTGWNRAELSIQDYPITHDDTYFLAFDVADRIRVLAIDEGRSNMYLDAVYKDQPEFDYHAVPAGSLDYSQIKGNQFVILSNLSSISSGLSAAIAAFLTNGGTVCVFPGYKCDMQSYNAFFSSLGVSAFTDLNEGEQEVAKIDLQQGIFKDVFEKVPENMGLPKVRKYYQINGRATGMEPSVLTLKSGNEFLTRDSYRSGTIYVCASPLDKAYSDLPVHAIFAPMLYRMAIMGSRAEELAYTIGDKKGIEVASRGGGNDKVYKVKGDQMEFIPEQLALGSKVILGLKDQIKKSGFYRVSLENSDSADVIAMNYDRLESNLSFYKVDELKSKYNGSNMTVVNSVGMEVAQVIKEMDRGVSLWKLFLILALVALAAETLLLRFWRT
jgi:hypothetical protein